MQISWTLTHVWEWNTDTAQMTQLTLNSEIPSAISFGRLTSADCAQMSVRRSAEVRELTYSTAKFQRFMLEKSADVNLAQNWWRTPFNELYMEIMPSDKCQHKLKSKFVFDVSELDDMNMYCIDRHIGKSAISIVHIDQELKDFQEILRDQWWVWQPHMPSQKQGQPEADNVHSRKPIVSSQSSAVSVPYRWASCRWSGRWHWCPAQSSQSGSSSSPHTAAATHVLSGGPSPCPPSATRAQCQGLRGYQAGFVVPLGNEVPSKNLHSRCSEVDTLRLQACDSGRR